MFAECFLDTAFANVTIGEPQEGPNYVSLAMKLNSRGEVLAWKPILSGTSELVYSFNSRLICSKTVDLNISIPMAPQDIKWIENSTISPWFSLKDLISKR